MLCVKACVAVASLTVLGFAAQASEKTEQAENTRLTPVVRAVRTAKNSVVNISTTRIVRGLDEDIFRLFNFGGPVVRKMHSLGSGFIIHPSGYIVTNGHVVQQASEITVSLADKTTLRARKIGADFEHDLAVIKLIDPPKSLKALKLGRGDDLMIGETVIAIGNPLGYQHTVTTGVVSAVNRKLEFRRGRVYRGLIQTDASINPGNSGGPLLNINGELIGINTAIRGDAQNIGFAINVESLKYLLPKLFDVESLRRIDLGFSVSPMIDRHRLRVVSVAAGSPADKAGIEAGDIIVGSDGKAISDPVSFYVAMYERPTGSALKLVVERKSGRVSLTLPFEAKPKPDGARLARQRLGLVLTELPDRDMVVVKEVVPGSPARPLGIRRGDVIDQLSRYSIESLDDVGQILEQVRSGQQLYIGFIRATEGRYYRAAGPIEVR